jgi:GNAT superfamily N-acetyltransferase
MSKGGSPNPTSEPADGFSVEGGLFHARPMRHDDVVPAFAVVQSVRGEIPLEEWSAHMAEFMPNAATPTPHHEPDSERHDPSFGGAVAIDPKGYIVGLFTYLCRRTLGVGPTLELHDFCVVTLARRRDASAVLLGYAEDLARRLGCAAIRVDFLESEFWNRDEVLPEGPPLEGAYTVSAPPALKVIG